ncbi:MAG: hypothetical protein F8N38_21245 [Hungatella sp.]|nr:hypothetical protein [Hungatella sp.]
MKKYVSMMIYVLMLFGLHVVPVQAAEPAPGVQTAAEYQTYLNAHYGTITTNLVPVDVTSYIKVIENQDQFKTYDLAVVIDYDVIAKSISVGDILGSTAYTEEQKTVFKDSFKSYQKQISDLTVATFPDKKVRGGFVSSFYQYPNLKRGYHESAWYGWKNYDYTQSMLNWYDDTILGVLHWYEFGNVVGAPLDNL